MAGPLMTSSSKTLTIGQCPCSTDICVLYEISVVMLTS